MPPWRQLVRGIRVLAHRSRADEDIADEVQHFLDEATAAHIARGLSPEAARRAARLELGNVTYVREEVRGYGWENVVGSLLAARSLKLAVRGFIRTPGFTLTALLTIALSLGANLAVFAVIDSVLLRPLPFPDANGLVAIYNTYPKAGVDRDGSSVPNYYERRGRVAALSSVSLYRYGSATVGDEGATERAEVLRVTPEFFTTLGVGPSSGRAFVEQEMDVGANAVVVLTDGYWRDRFGGDSTVVGRALRIDGVPRRIVGVLPSDFRFLSSRARLYLPLASLPEERASVRRHSGSNSDMVARLRPSATLADAQREIDAQNAALEKQDPEAKMMRDAAFRSVVVPLHADHVASIRPTLLLLQAGVLLLVLIAAVNLANLLSIRASARTRELMIRQSIGATRWNLLSQVLVETLAITISGGLLGLVVGAVGIRLIGSLGVEQLPLGSRVSFDGRAALVTLGAASLLGLLIALPIAWVHVRGDLALSLKAESRGGTAARAATRFRNGFIVAQVALAFVLLAGGMLLGLSLKRAMDSSPGFRADHALTGQISLPARTYPTKPSIVGFSERLLADLRAQPGVVAAGASTNVPLSGNTIKSAVVVPGFVPRPGESLHGHYTYSVTGDYFAALGIALRAGRFIGSADVQQENRVCVVDEDFARRYWPGESAIGHRVFAFTVVGVVAPVKQADVTEAQAQGAVYFPFNWRVDRVFFLVTRTAQSAESFGTTMSKVVRRLDPDLPADGIRSMDARVSDSLITRRSPALLAAIFASVALLLAAIGTYGVLSYAVAQRRREIGVRLALGAQPKQIAGAYLSRGLHLLAAGLVLGLAGTWLMGRALERVLFAVAPLDAVALISTTAVIAVVSLAASLLPARRAARIDPMIALAAE